MMTKKFDDKTKEELIQILKELQNASPYGLNWEDKPELIAEKCKEEIPILREEKNKQLISDINEPSNILIEGDNYHSLAILNYTHEKCFDLIYIDPPYNTGKKDNIFVYNDKIVDKSDIFRHSKWISFMNKRLVLAKNLMKETGIIIISIDDNEVANLRLLCNEIFVEENFVACLPTVMNLKGNQDQFGFAGTHEYTLVYCYDKSKAKFNDFEIDEEELDKWDVDEQGYYKEGANLKATGVNAPREKRPYLYYPILIDLKDLSALSISKQEYEKIYDKETNSFDDTYVESLRTKYVERGFEFILPITSGQKMTWRWQRSKVNSEPGNLIIKLNKGNYSVYKKQRPSLTDLPSKKPKTLFYKPEYSSGNGTAELKKIFNKKVFNNPKPIELIKDFVRIGSDKDGTILDFFAGSGTTGQAIIELNEEDCGTRKFVLCTNNENNIAQNVFYPRIKAVINGYKSTPGIPTNVRYFKTDFIKKGKVTDDLRWELVGQCVDMLSVRENTFNQIINKEEYKILKNNEKITGILFDLDSIEEFKKMLEKQLLPARIYIFSLTNDEFVDDFSDCNFEHEICPIPESILNIYKHIFRENK